jgi:hypothetical protein
MLFRQAEDIDLDVELVVRAVLGDDPTGQHIKVLEPLEDASERAGVSVGDDAQSTKRVGWR